MNLRPVTIDNALSVASRMREWDRREIYATRPDEDPVGLAHACTVHPQYAWTAHIDEDPVAVVGAHPLHPNVWTVYAFATDRFREIAFPLTKFIRNAMIPALAQFEGVRRAQCLSMAGHADAHRWLTYLGAKRQEQPLEKYGKGGEDFYVFAWLN